MQGMYPPTRVENAVDNAQRNEFGPVEAGAWLRR